MDIQKLVQIAVTILIALVLLKVIAGLIVAISVPLIVLLVKVIRVLIVIAAVLFIARLLGFKINR